MGVPAFFRWLCRKYPLVVTPCVEEKARFGQKADSTGPNPNGIEFDNLYLDMNGIIHPCTHPEDRPAPKNEDEMMVAIFEAIDRLFHIVRPRKLLYMAIDGVAPRAKMNQQRSRRFRASKESAEKQREMARIREELRSRGCELPPEKSSGEHFDSNCITPGTPFMARLSECLHYYIHDRLTNNPAWAGIKVILSDASVPGEGEHKIQDYIRKQRAQPGHDPNTQHVLCGADADLIMLGLATHEPNFTIIREELKPNEPRPCELCGQKGHEMQECEGLSKDKKGEFDELPGQDVPSTEFIFVRLAVLREYLAKELEMPNLPFPYDFERAVDDWVFMCFFVGNDFLPHLPSLEIREGAIDRLVNLYKDCVYKTGGWLTDSGFFTPSRVQLIMHELGKVEDQIFKDRQRNEEKRKFQDRARKRAKSDSNTRPSYIPGGQFAPTAVGSAVRPLMNAHKSIQETRIEAFHYQQTANYSAAANLKILLRDPSDGAQSAASADSSPHGQKRKHEDEEEETPDEVRLFEEGFKDRYYESKFHVGPDNLEFREHVGHEYVLGLAWVLQYYYQGCPSWEWFFPYHYACFASDFTNISDMKLTFPKNTQPFTPLEQLMAVFPAASRSHVPEPWGRLMTDPESDIADFYPSDFMIDLNGKKFAWQGVALLPFVDEKRLKDTLKNYHHLLTDAERKRNSRGEAVLYTGRKHKSYRFMRALYAEDVQEETVIEAKEFEGMGGNILLSEVCVHEDGVLETPVNGLPNLYSVNVVSVSYRDPKYSVDFVFASKRLPNAKTPTPQLKSQDLAKVGRSFRGSHNMGPRTHQAFVAESGHRKLNFALQSQDQGYRGQQDRQFDNRGHYRSGPSQFDGNYAYGGAPYAPTYNGPPRGGFMPRPQYNQGRDNTYSAPVQSYNRQSYGYETAKQNGPPMRHHPYQAPGPRGGMAPRRDFDGGRNQPWDNQRHGSSNYRGRSNGNYRR